MADVEGGSVAYLGWDVAGDGGEIAGLGVGDDGGAEGDEDGHEHGRDRKGNAVKAGRSGTDQQARRQTGGSKGKTIHLDLLTGNAVVSRRRGMRLIGFWTKVLHNQSS
jgi:hypothetical protein